MEDKLIILKALLIVINTEADRGIGIYIHRFDQAVLATAGSIRNQFYLISAGLRVRMGNILGGYNSIVSQVPGIINGARGDGAVIMEVEAVTVEAWDAVVNGEIGRRTCVDIHLNIPGEFITARAGETEYRSPVGARLRYP